MSSARETIFASIRRGLAGVRGLDLPAGAGNLGAPRDLTTHTARVARFKEVLERVGGFVHVVASEAEASEALRVLVSDLGARDVAISDAPLVRELALGLGADTSSFDGSRDRTRLIDCDLGLSTAQWGVAETGSLVLLGPAERHRLVSLVPPTHVAVLESERILPTLGDALAAARGEGIPPHLITLITGPSRSGDIELKIVIGVHGPKALHVILIDRSDSTREAS